jgi:hypothetical protein
LSARIARQGKQNHPLCPGFVYPSPLKPRHGKRIEGDTGNKEVGGYVSLLHLQSQGVVKGMEEYGSMNVEMLEQAWRWLLSLSKVQLVLLGGGLAFVVAVSKTMRVLFLLSVLLLSLVFGLPHAIRYYKENPLSGFIPTFLSQDSEAAKDTPSADKESTK